MRAVTLMYLVLAGLVGVASSGAGAVARGVSAPPASAAPQAPPAPAAATQPAAAPPVSAGRGVSPSGIRAADRRRRSYASCNRESHNRSLRGGARRRFLIRCKLGYERRRPGQAPTLNAQPLPQTPPAKTNPAPAQPAKSVPSPSQQPAKRP